MREISYRKLLSIDSYWNSWILPAKNMLNNINCEWKFDSKKNRSFESDCFNDSVWTCSQNGFLIIVNAWKESNFEFEITWVCKWQHFYFCDLVLECVSGSSAGTLTFSAFILYIPLNSQTLHCHSQRIFCFWIFLKRSSRSWRAFQQSHTLVSPQIGISFCSFFHGSEEVFSTLACPILLITFYQILPSLSMPRLPLMSVLPTCFSWWNPCISCSHIQVYIIISLIYDLTFYNNKHNIYIYIKQKEFMFVLPSFVFSSHVSSVSIFDIICLFQFIFHLINIKVFICLFNW